MARIILGIAGPGGADSEALQEWLLKFGDNSKKNCISVESFVEWLVNQNQSLVDYRDFMSVCLIVLDNIPGLCLVGARETWHRSLAKCMLMVKGTEAIHAYKYDQICAVLKVVIDGAVHGVHSIWEPN